MLSEATDAHAQYVARVFPIPDGFSTVSVHGVSGGAPTGYAGQNWNVPRATLWDRVSGAPIDLHPGGGFTSSAVYGAAGAFQLGAATLSGTRYAAVWSGSAASHVLLSRGSGTVPTFNAAAAGSMDGIRVVGSGSGGLSGSTFSKAAYWPDYLGTTVVNLHPQPDGTGVFLRVEWRERHRR